MIKAYTDPLIMATDSESLSAQGYKVDNVEITKAADYKFEWVGYHQQKTGFPYEKLTWTVTYSKIEPLNCEPSYGSKFPLQEKT